MTEAAADDGKQRFLKHWAKECPTTADRARLGGYTTESVADALWVLLPPKKEGGGFLLRNVNDDGLRDALRRNPPAPIDELGGVLTTNACWLEEDYKVEPDGLRDVRVSGGDPLRRCWALVKDDRAMRKHLQ
jgi:hypothetical protein